MQHPLHMAAGFLHTLAISMATVATAAGAGPGSESGNVDLARYPSLSPDGTRVVFSWRGDLWMVPSEGGDATRLTSHPADDLRSAWSPDGAMIVFESTRDGTRNLWAMNADGTGVRQLTQLDTPVTLAAVGRDHDGQVIVTFDSNRENDFYRAARPYKVPLQGGAIERVHDAFGTRAVPSPDGSAILFERGGASWSRRGYRGSDSRDVWLFDRRDGSFRRLTSWEGNDGFARWLNDREIVYLSDAEGGVINVFTRSIDAPPEVSGRARTSLRRDARDLAVSLDGRLAVVESWGRLHRVDLQSPTPTTTELAIRAVEDERSLPRWRRIDRDVTEASLNPDGKSIALVAYGDLFIRSMEEKAQAVRITDTPWRESQIAWSPDGLALYFTSDESGRDQIHAVRVSRTRTELRRSFAPDPSATVETDEPADGRGVEPGSGDDGDEGGDRKENGVGERNEAGRMGEDAKSDRDPGKRNDQETASDGPASASKRTSAHWADAISFEFAPVVTGSEAVRQPSPSPDGLRLAYRRGRGDLWLRTLDTGEERRVRSGWDSGIAWRFSPDGRWLAVQQQDRDFNSDIWVVPVDGSADAVNITRHPDSDVDPRWSADGRMLAFRSNRVNDEFDVWLVALDKSLEAMTAAEREKYAKDAVEAAKKRKPLPAPGSKTQEPSKTPAPTLSLDDAYLRLVRVTTMSGNEGQLEMTPGGDRLIFTSSEAGPMSEESGASGGGLFSVKWDGSDQKRLGASANVQEVSLTGDKVVLIRDGRPVTVPPGGGESKTIDFAASTRIDPREEMRRRFIALAAALGEGFYHPTMKGLDWERLTREYLDLVVAARTADEFDDVAARFLGELNASHLGVTSPADGGAAERRALGRLGVRTRPAADGFEVTAVIADSPAARGATPLAVGDVILSIDGRPVAGAGTVEERLAGRVNEEVVVSIRRTLPTGATVERDALVAPISSADLARLIQLEWQRDLASRVHEWSDGRIGYIHIQSMDQPSLDRFERDLYAAAEGRDGLIIDVRNNGGGWTADRLLASIMAPVHAYTVPRGADPEYTLGYPRDRLYIQRYTLPITMLANEKSFSNAEIIAHAFKTLGRGTLVGETTAGGVISTGSVRLLDGTIVRMPFRGWYLPDGTDMENNGAVPHIRVPQRPEDEVRREDAQLRRAVEELLGRLGPATKRSHDG